MKRLTRSAVSYLLLVLALTGCGSTQSGQTSKVNSAAGLASVAINQSSDNTVLLSSMNLNREAFKNMGDLAFVWQGLLYVLDGKTGEVKQLTNFGNAQHPIWSHDGQWIAFIAKNTPNENNGQLWLVRRDGQQAHKVQGLAEVTNARNISWSPTANVLGVSNQDGLWLVPADGEPHLQVKGLISFGDAGWSPDGKAIAYSVTLPFDKDHPEIRADALYTVNLSTGQVVKQTTASGAGIQVAGWWPSGEGVFYWLNSLHSASLAADGMPLWSLRFGDAEPTLLSTGLAHPGWQALSPQGQLLMVTGGGRTIWRGKSLTITDPGTGSSTLPNPDGFVTLDPSYSPDGRRIAFVAAKDLGNVLGFSNPDELVDWVATRTLWIENADGSDAHSLKTAGTGIYQPVWSKDGSRILYVQNNSLWTIGANGDNPEKILGPFPDWKDQFGYYGYIWHDEFAWFRP